MMEENIIFNIDAVSKTFFPSGGFLNFFHHPVFALKRVSLEVTRGEIFSLVGESGCGKSTLARIMARLIEPTEGEIHFNGINLLSLKSHELRKMREKFQIVFQNPYASLNPRMTIREILSEPLKLHKGLKKNGLLEKIVTLLEDVGLEPSTLEKYPHEFSGGQRQRIAIARAISINPDFLICDEPVSSLDLSIQTQILELLLNLKERYSITIFFISHDLNVVRLISDRIAVMYCGKIVEIASKEELFDSPLHPYSRLLISSIPSLYKKTSEVSQTKINEPSAISETLEKVCSFYATCPEKTARCLEEEPILTEISPTHKVACHACNSHIEK